jgi:hypothetical protein
MMNKLPKSAYERHLLVLDRKVRLVVRRGHWVGQRRFEDDEFEFEVV